MYKTQVTSPRRQLYGLIVIPLKLIIKEAFILTTAFYDLCCLSYCNCLTTIFFSRASIVASELPACTFKFLYSYVVPLFYRGPENVTQILPLLL